MTKKVLSAFISNQQNNCSISMDYVNLRMQFGKTGDDFSTNRNLYYIADFFAKITAFHNF